jgi:GNAT superfamily N-acetyltransferase
VHTLRPAAAQDADAIAHVWHAAWHDAHAEHVPHALIQHRTLDHFLAGAVQMIDRSTVAEDDSGLLGFVAVTDDELEFLFVAAQARGTGVAADLLARGERQLADLYDTAWLEVVTGNARARRFYERQGWSDVGGRDGVIDTPSGRLVVAYHRYEKRLRT